MSLTASPAVRWAVATAVVPIGFYVGLSMRESREEEEREMQRRERVIQQRVAERLAQIDAMNENHSSSGPTA